MPHDQSSTEYLARLVLNIREAELTQADRSVVRQHFLDGVASAFIGCRSSEFRELSTLSTAVSGKSPQELGMLWGFAVNGSVFEDGSREGACHPAAAVIPAVLAFMGEASWDQVDRAVVAGYDVMIRLARCGNPQFARKGFHPTAIAAPFGAAAAVALLLGFDHAATQNALSLAAMGSSGLMASFKYGPTQPLQVAWGVRSGIEAALLAGKGHAGYHRIIDEGFFPAYLGCDPAKNLDAPLERDYAVTGCYLKPWPGCRHLHASLDAFDRLATEYDLDSERIERIEVGTYKVAIDTGIKTLDRRGDAYFNIPYALAARAVLGRIDFDAFDEKHFALPAIRGLMANISVTVDPEVEQKYPQRRGSRVTVTLADGTLLTEQVEFPLGEPENPLSPDVTTAKLHATASAYLVEEDLRRVATVLDVTGKPQVSPEQVQNYGLAVFDPQDCM